ncbi:MAG: anti-sigma factor antagonist [Streptosporangiaceae bacterium]
MGSAEDRGGRLLLECRLDGGVAVVRVTGEVDVFTSGELREGLLRVISDENERSLVLNLSGVSFIDSTGTGVLVGVWHRVRATNGMLAVAAPSRQARGILEMTGLARMLRVYETESEAMRACRPVARQGRRR